MIPSREDELREALASGSLQEGQHLDLKRELAATDRANRDLAIDMASFAIEGGAIFIGVDEGPPPLLSPVDLDGLRERVEQIARSRIDPPLRVEVREIAARTGGGYLVVTIPPSEDAPHAVQNVFRGRSGSLNAPLGATEVRRLHERASKGDLNSIARELRSFIDRDPVPADRRQHGHLFIVARPQGTVADALEENVGAEWKKWTRDVLGHAPRLTAEWAPDLGQAHALARVPGGWVATSLERPRHVGARFYESGGLEIEFAENGTLRLFCSRGTDDYKGPNVILEVLVGGLAHRMTYLAERVSEAIVSSGHWDWAIGLTGIAGARSFFRLDNWFNDRDDVAPYPEPEYTRTTTTSVNLVLNEPHKIVERLVGPLNRTLNDGRAALPRSQEH